VTYASRRRASTATTDATESARRQVRTAIKKLCEACRIVRRRGRLFVVCAKTPKHKQRQGVHTGARERERGERATTLAASGEEALARTCCESVRGGDGFDARGLALTGNYRRHAAMPSLLPRIAQF
jgi:large subunit ribosomal protein L36